MFYAVFLQRKVFTTVYIPIHPYWNFFYRNQLQLPDQASYCTCAKCTNFSPWACWAMWRGPRQLWMGGQKQYHPCLGIRKWEQIPAGKGACYPKEKKTVSKCVKGWGESQDYAISKRWTSVHFQVIWRISLDNLFYLRKMWICMGQNGERSLLYYLFVFKYIILKTHD